MVSGVVADVEKMHTAFLISNIGFGWWSVLL
jgi:hypothetical protein